MAGRASIVGAAETSVGKVRDHNEDSHFFDPEAGIFVVCDGMGGHAAGEIASAIAVKTVREAWESEAMQKAADQWLARGTPEAHKRLLAAVTQGVVAAHDAIIAEAKADRGKTGMGTTIVGGIVVGGEMVFAHCGDSRAYLVRDGIAMQLTEDHTLLARLLAAGVDVDTEGEGSRFKSMLTNALGIGQECKASTFVVPLADGDRFLLCSDGITEYVKENEIGEVLGKAPSPARAAQKLVEMALDRGGGDNATALVVRVLEAGEISRPAEELRRDEAAIFACPLWAKCNPQQRLRALRIALPRDHALDQKVPAMTLGDRVAWIVIEGQLDQDGTIHGPGALVYPEALLPDRPLPDKDGLAVPLTEVRALALRSDDFRELCEEDPDLAEQLMAALGDEIANRARRRLEPTPEVDWRKTTDPDMEHGPTLAPGSPSPFSEAARTSTRRIRPRSEPGATRLDNVDNETSRRTTDPNITASDADATNPGRSPTAPPFATRATTEPLPDTAARDRAKTDTDVGGPPAPRPPALPALGNPFRAHPRGSDPPTPLKSGKAETEAALDKAMDKLTGVDSDWGETPDESQPETRPDGGMRRKRSESGERETEIVVEADEPPDRPTPPARGIKAAPPPFSEPEIEITRLADEAEKSEGEVIEMTVDDGSAPKSKPPSDQSEPEILIVRQGRAITADDTKLVAGAIEPKRPKRGTDA